MLTLAHLVDLAIAVVTGALFALALGQVCRPWQDAPAGAPLKQVQLPFRARLRLHGVWLLTATFVIMTATALDILVTPWPLVVAAVAAVALLAVPVRYTLTDRGIAVGRTPMRRWTEFAGLTARNGWIYLQPVGGARGLLIRTPEAGGADAFAVELRGLVRGSYKGLIGPYRPTVERPEWPETAEEGVASRVASA